MTVCRGCYHSIARTQYSGNNGLGSDPMEETVWRLESDEDEDATPH